jgi:glycosyltransferase involved in cell wall biosynthesis
MWEDVEVYYPRFLQFPRNLFLASSGKRMYSGIKKLVHALYQGFKFDVIHAHVALPDGFAGIMVKEEYKRPLVVTIHGADLQVTIYGNAACREALAHVFKEADKVIVVSTKLKKILEGNFGISEKATVLSYGINIDIATIKNTTMSSRYAGSKIILSVSNLIASKGLDLNINAMSRLIGKYLNLKYLVIGTGPEISFLKKLTCDLNLEHQVEFLGELPHYEAMQYMAIADIFSLPSWREGFGNVYLEAMTHGKPVIACDGEGITDVIKHGENGLLVKPKDVESLAQAMDFLLANPDKARELGRRAQKLVLENYTWEKNARKYIEIYRELLANHG